MKQRFVTSVVALLIFCAVLFLLPQAVVFYVFSALCALACYEFLSSNAKIKGKYMLLISSIIIAAQVPMGSIPGREKWLMLLIVVYVLILLILKISKVVQLDTYAFVHALIGTLAVPLLLSSVVKIFMLVPNGKYVVLLPFAIAWATDISAQWGGILLGKHKLAPKISPKKTIEGSVCGLLGGAVGAYIFGISTLGAYVPVWGILCLGMLGSVLSQIGDLTMSYFKRKNRIKDFGNILPGHGGFLDRFDSVMLSAPFVEIIFRVLGII